MSRTALLTSHRLAFVAALVSLGVATLAVSANGRPAQAPDVRHVAGYHLDNSPGAAASYAGNKIVVIASVETLLEPRWNTDDPARLGALAFIYTPVQVTVTKVLRGVPRLAGQSLVVRHLGGRIGDDSFVFEEELAPAGLEPGARVLLFLGEQRDVGDGLDAATPNMLYVIAPDGTAKSSDGRWSIDLAAFETLLGLQ